jgi:uncharacterized protein
MAGKIIAVALIGLFCLIVFFGCQALQRSALFYPTNNSSDNGLARWMNEGALIGFAREVSQPETIWLMLHGNSGQAADRVYALDAYSPGTPSRNSFDAAALEAYQLLRARFPGKPVCVAAESIGSGPAAMLGAAKQPPDKLVFIVPFDDLKSVGKDHMRYMPMSLLLAGTWDNVEAVSSYNGPIDVFGAEQDEVINVRHAQALAASRPQAKFHLIRGAHNDWSTQPDVRIRNP